MILTTALPDEISVGYLGRLRAINQLKSNSVALTALRRFLLDTAPSDRFAEVAVLARATRMSTRDFLRLHTQAAFRWAVSFSRQSWSGKGELISSTRSHVFRLDHSVGPTCYCELCAQEDKVRWGYTYWHRRHNLPGLDWCMKHRVPLTRVCGLGRFEDSPLKAANSENSEVEIAVEAYPECPVALRYGEILVGFMESNSPMHCAMARVRIKKLMQAHELRLTEARLAYIDRPTFTKFAQSMADREWLESTFAFSSQQRIRGYSRWGDSVEQIAQSPTLVALALALFFETSDEALDYWIATA